MCVCVSQYTDAGVQGDDHAASNASKQHPTTQAAHVKIYVINTTLCVFPMRDVAHRSYLLAEMLADARGVPRSLLQPRPTVNDRLRDVARAAAVLMIQTVMERREVRRCVSGPTTHLQAQPFAAHCS